MAIKRTLYDQNGEKLSRFGKAGVQRALMAPVKILGNAKSADYAMVRCEETDTYITRDGAGQRSCTFHVMWWVDNEARGKDFEFSKRDSAINLFLKKSKEPIHEVA